MCARPRAARCHARRNMRDNWTRTGIVKGLLHRQCHKGRHEEPVIAKVLYHEAEKGRRPTPRVVVHHHAVWYQDCRPSNVPRGGVLLQWGSSNSHGTKRSPQVIDSLQIGLGRLVLARQEKARSGVQAAEQAQEGFHTDHFTREVGSPSPELPPLPAPAIGAKFFVRAKPKKRSQSVRINADSKIRPTQRQSSTRRSSLSVHLPRTAGAEEAKTAAKPSTRASHSV